MTTRRRLLLTATVTLIAAAVVVVAPRALRLLPLLTADNDGTEQVVLLHGLGRTPWAMLLLEGTLRGAGFEVHSLGYPSLDGDPEALLEGVRTQIDACCIDADRTVHFVGHSLGGLLIRAYLGTDPPPNLGRVVLIASPNGGSELADAERHGELTGSLLEQAGPTAAALTTGPDGFPASLPPLSYEVGVIAGTSDNPLSNAFLPVPNDGMVSVESTRLPGMADFVTFDLNHAALRNDPRVADAVVSFLRSGAFELEIGRVARHARAQEPRTSAPAIAPVLAAREDADAVGADFASGMTGLQSRGCPWHSFRNSGRPAHSPA